MSHSHDDRIAERPAHLCAAYGCPLLGSSTSSTQGTSEWWCFAHFGANAGAYQRITAELHSLDWLAKAITDIRSRHQHRDEWPAHYHRIDHDLMLNQRNDLRFSGAMHSRMDTELWLQRLEGELAGKIHAAVADIPAAPKQNAIPEGKSVGAFNRVGFEVPA